MMRRFLASTVALAALAAGPAAAETVAITNARLVTGDGAPVIEGATVVFDEGGVRTVGSRVSIPDSARVIDAEGKYVTPGLFAGFSRVGLVEVDAVSETNDQSASRSDFSAALDVAYAVDPSRSAFAVSRAAGVTRAVVAPSTASGDIFAGQGAVVDLGDDANFLTKGQAFQFVEMGERGASRAGGSRMATHTLFRAQLREARDYAAGRSDFDDELLTAEDAKALLPVIDGRVPLLVHVESANDIRLVLGLKADFPKLRLVLVGATEGWRVADEIAAAGVPVIASALADLPARFEQLAATQSNIGRMVDAGVEVAIGMIDDNDAHQIRYTPQYAGNLVGLEKLPGRSGLSWEEAFASISSVPADIMGMGGKLGVLKPGAFADVVLWDGDPLELSSAPVTVWIDGVEQSLDSHQQRLRERYRTPTPGNLPKAYD